MRGGCVWVHVCRREYLSGEYVFTINELTNIWNGWRDTERERERYEQMGNGHGHGLMLTMLLVNKAHMPCYTFEYTQKADDICSFLLK